MIKRYKITITENEDGYYSLTQPYDIHLTDYKKPNDNFTVQHISNENFESIVKLFKNKNLAILHHVNPNSEAMRFVCGEILKNNIELVVDI